MQNYSRSLILSLSLLFIATGCSSSRGISFPVSPTAAESSAILSAADLVLLSVSPASVSQCAYGGSLMQLFKDTNINGVLDSGEVVISSSAVCNGANGTNGISAGVEVKPATGGSCPSGGTQVNTFQDFNCNGILDGSEVIVSSSTICNGSNGSNGVDGRNAIISSSAATPQQCSNGGIAYSTYTDGETPVVSAVCNGSNGTSASFAMGTVGPMVAGKAYSSCHHDYLYLPNSTSSQNGWLVFRHQKNGSADQGINTTGFNLWNVDIADFGLASEGYGVTYCNLHWDPITRILSYSVVDNTDGQAGQSGTIQL